MRRFLVWMLIGCSSAAVSPTAGAMVCVDPKADATQRLSCDPRVEPGCDVLREETIADLDGDGVADDLVAADRLCGATGNCSYYVYLSGNGCSHFAGEAAGVMVRPENTRHNGLRDLSGYWKGGCVAMEGTGWTAAFDGTRYRAVESYSCQCPDEPKTAPRDPRCPGPE